MYKVILHNQSAEFEASYPTEASRTLWNDEVADDRILLNPQVKDSMVEIPTFTFTILPNHPLYGQIRKFKSVITVYCGSRVMFFGRVIGDGNDFYGQKNVSCEGALSFFIDSVQDPMKETSKTPTEMLNQIVTAHNQQMASEPFKLMTVGTITIDDALASKKFKIEGYSQTKGVLEGSMTNDYKGYFRIRRENNTTYIDWLKDFNRVNAQPVKMEVNMLDRTNEEEADEYYTVLLPVGSNNRTLTNKYLEDADGIAEYGRIIKPMSFSDAKTQEKLLEEAQKEFAKRGTHIPRSIHVKAVDMHLLGENVDEILCGDKMTNVEDRTGAYFEDLTVVEVTYDLLNPANDEYTLENQEALDKRRSSGNGSLSSRAARIDGGLDENTRNLIKHYDNITLDVENVYSLTADIIREQARLYEVTAKTFHAFIDEGYVDSYSPAYIQTVTVDGQEYHVQGFSGTTSHQDTSGTGSWVQEITGVVVEQQYPRGKENSPTFDPTVSYMVGDYVFYTPEGGNKGLYKFVLPHQGPWNDVHVQVVTKEWLPVYKKDANGDDVYDLITGEAIYQTLDEMRENQVHVPLRSIAQQTQTEFYQIVGTTDISTVLHYPSESSGAGEFSPTTQYAVNDYVYCKVDTHNNFDQNGVKTLFKFINPHQGAWNKADVVEVTKITIQDMTGSNLWQDEDHIVAVVGTMEVVDTVPTGAAESPAFSSSASYLAGDMVWYPDKTSASKKLYKFKVDHQGAWNASHVTQITTKSVQIVEGSGLSVYQDGTSVGLYKDGLLNAGLMVESLNEDNDTSVKIKASKVAIQSTSGSSITIDQNGNIDVNVTNLDDAINNNAAFRINANRINLTSGAVIKAINGGQTGSSELTIDADKLNLTGYVTSEGLETTMATILSAGVASLSIDDQLEVSEYGQAFFNGPTYVQGVAISNALYAIDITGPTNNVYTLRSQTIYESLTDSWTNVGTFSRAVSSFTPTWNGSTYQVTANPQNQPYSQTFALVLTGQPPASSFSAIFGEAASGGQGAVATTRISKPGYLHEFTDSGTKYVGVFTAYNSSNQTYSGEIARIQVTGGTTITALNLTEVTESAYNSSSYTAQTVSSVSSKKYYTVGTTPNTNVGIKFETPATGVESLTLSSISAAGYNEAQYTEKSLIPGHHYITTAKSYSGDYEYFKFQAPVPDNIVRTSYDTSNKTVTVKATYGNEDILTGKVIDATEVWGAGKRSGWNSAVGAASVPTTQSTTNNYISVKIPKTVVSPNESTNEKTEYKYTVSCDDDYCYIHYDTGDDGIEVARTPNTKQGGSYNQGWDALITNMSSASASNYVQFSGASAYNSALSKTSNGVTGYVWVKDSTGEWQRTRQIPITHTIVRAVHKSSAHSGSLELKIRLTDSSTYKVVTSEALPDQAWNQLST